MERLAVGAAPGTATLFLSKESWAHSLYEHMIEVTGSEEIGVTDLRTLLARAQARRPEAPIILKVNIEGAAGDVLFATPPAELAPVVEVHLDHEPGSPHSITDILKHLAHAGLTEVEAHPDQLFRITRRAHGFE